MTKNIGLPLPSSTLNVWADGFNMSWEVDFWGRYRRTIEGAEADLDASVESYGDTLVMLLSEVATSYVQLRTYEERLQFARQNVTVQKRSLQLAETRFRNGRGTELDVRQARSSLSQTESLIPPLITGRRQAANQLCTLLGVPVANLADELSPAGIPKPPLEVAVGIPADLLRRRPDVRRAERQVAAQSARIGVAEADLYPRLSINGFVGFVADDFKDLFTSKSFTGLFFPTLQWNVLNYGRIHNNIKTQDARLETVTFQYQQTVLNAGREVENALTAFLQAQEQAKFLEDSVRDAQRSVDLVLLQFEGGVVDFNRVYITQTTLLTAQDQLATTRGNIALQLIQVYRRSAEAGSASWTDAACRISRARTCRRRHLPPLRFWLPPRSRLRPLPKFRFRLPSPRSRLTNMEFQASRQRNAVKHPQAGRLPARCCYERRWRKAQEHAERVKVAIKTSGHRSGSSTSNPAPSK